MIDFVYNDGGRKEAGYRGRSGDCVTRAIAIATGKPYKEVYDGLFSFSKEYSFTRRNKVAKLIKLKGASPRDGVYMKVIKEYMKNIGWKWQATMQIGQGCKVHLRADELPKGRLIVQVSKHLTAVVDGVINDTANPSRGGTRCVYGYFYK